MRRANGWAFTHEELARGREGLLRVQEVVREYNGLTFHTADRRKLTKAFIDAWAEILQINDAGVEE